MAAASDGAFDPKQPEVEGIQVKPVAAPQEDSACTVFTHEEEAVSSFCKRRSAVRKKCSCGRVRSEEGERSTSIRARPRSSRWRSSTP